MEFIKNEDITDIIHDESKVGYIRTQRNSEKKVQGYSIQFFSNIWGYNFGDYTKTYKSALKVAGIQYSKMLERIKSNPFYVKELDMYFPKEENYNNFKTTVVAEQRLKDVMKRSSR